MIDFGEIFLSNIALQTNASGSKSVYHKNQIFKKLLVTQNHFRRYKIVIICNDGS